VLLGQGRGVWESRAGRWATVSKAEVQQRFERGDLKVLVCTEAAGEGLNLQNCGAIINYDMPWNPMKVEQRIGRIDRLGQRRPEVVVLHFLYEGTVKARVYEALSRRIGWFETVVGELQPILRRAYLAIQRAAMEPPEGRDTVLAEELEAVAAERPLPELEGWHGHLEAAGPRRPLPRRMSPPSSPPTGLRPTRGHSAATPTARGYCPGWQSCPRRRPGRVWCGWSGSRRGCAG